MEKLLSVDSGYFCAGVVLNEGAVIFAAPILNYKRGWTLGRVEAYCRKKGWNYEVV